MERVVKEVLAVAATLPAPPSALVVEVGEAGWQRLVLSAAAILRTLEASKADSCHCGHQSGWHYRRRGGCLECGCLAFVGVREAPEVA